MTLLAEVLMSSNLQSTILYHINTFESLITSILYHINESMDPISVGVGLCAAGAVGIWYLLRGRATSNVALYNIPVAKVAKLHVYPVKSCHRIEVDTVECLKRGLKYDR